MRFLITLRLATAFCFLPCLLAAQFKLPTGFSISDTTQVHVLTTQKGDVLIGRCVGWSGDSITFLSDTGQRLFFSVQTLAQLSNLGEAQQFGGYGMFRIVTKKGVVYEGFPKRYNGKTMVFRLGRNDQKTFELSEIANMEFIPGRTGFKLDTVANNYRVKYGPIRPRKAEVRLVGYHDSKFLLLRPGQFVPDTIAGSQTTQIRYLKPFREAFGYARSSLFAPTGFNLEKGRREFRNIGFYIFNSVAFGITDHFSISMGGLGYLPYFDAKVSYSLGDYLHGSLGGYTVTAVNYGYNAAISVGTPDYFLNFSYLRSREFEATNTNFNWDVLSIMASMRIGNRHRAFMEYDFLKEPDDEFGSFNVTRDGYRVALTGGIGWYNKRTRFEVGWMLTGPADIAFRCTNSGNCDDRSFYTPLPIAAFGVELRGKKKR